MSLLGALSRTKLYWGLIIIFAIGAGFSPETSRGHNIFLSYGNLTDVLRQVSITGLVATGMTMVILTGGIDLSVGSVMAFGSVITGMLLTRSGWTAAAVVSVPVLALVAFAGVAGLFAFVLKNIGRDKAAAIGHRRESQATGPGRIVVPTAAGLAVAALAAWYAAAQVVPKFSVPGVLVTVPAVGLVLGAITGLIIVGGRLQPFIVTLAMMVSVLGIARLTAGQDSAVLPVYPGSNATGDFDALRSMLWGVLPVPGLFFIAALLVFGALLRFTTFGRYVYSIGGNEEATRLSGIAVNRVKIATYAFSGLLACLAGVLYVAQYRQGKPDAGAGLELDAIAAVVIGGTSLMGGRGSLSGTFVGVFIFGLLSNILQLHNIDSNLQLVLKGAIIVVTVLVQERNLADFGQRFPLGRAVFGRSGSTGRTSLPPEKQQSTI
jgi:simple sugar transport system permease protein